MNGLLSLGTAVDEQQRPVRPVVVRTIGIVHRQKQEPGLLPGVGDIKPPQRVLQNFSLGMEQHVDDRGRHKTGLGSEPWVGLTQIQGKTIVVRMNVLVVQPGRGAELRDGQSGGLSRLIHIRWILRCQGGATRAEAARARST
ncbi:hypothetical protein GCM10007881_15800 [Mesorhizobium huakuii]|nr:hypothetical protein GCM10007881_15800 [Mesorhizobium huakuii]